jgi:hypothetical protein
MHCIDWYCEGINKTCNRPTAQLLLTAGSILLTLHFICCAPVFTSQEQKRYIEQQLNTDHEGPFGSRVSPNRPVSAKKVPGAKSNGSANGTPPNRRLSVSGHQNGRSGGKDGKRDSAKTASPGNVAAAKEDASSHISGTDPVPSTP